MLFQMPLERPGSALGIITSGDIEREIRRRGIYIEEVRYPEPVTRLPLPPPPPPPIYVEIPEVLPRPESPVVVIPEIPRVEPVEPWLPQYPSLTEPEEIEEVYTPPYTEELLMPLTPVRIPEAAKPASKVGLVLIIVVLGLAALTNNKKGNNAAKWRQTMARSRAM